MTVLGGKLGQGSGGEARDRRGTGEGQGGQAGRLSYVLRGGTGAGQGRDRRGTGGGPASRRSYVFWGVRFWVWRYYINNNIG
ncbi:hypothetical protein [Kamptonema formosum]|uniref:hypothetical protein n=1 Tax=Kamptonema formosum TaxID=331992 RepID=UPI000347742A|nr:hypothetical protein [Oscillatoria sp. PCC 10802]